MRHMDRGKIADTANIVLVGLASLAVCCDLAYYSTFGRREDTPHPTENKAIVITLVLIWITYHTRTLWREPDRRMDKLVKTVEMMIATCAVSDDLRNQLEISLFEPEQTNVDHLRCLWQTLPAWVLISFYFLTKANFVEALASALAWIPLIYWAWLFGVRTVMNRKAQAG